MANRTNGSVIGRFMMLANDERESDSDINVGYKNTSGVEGTGLYQFSLLMVCGLVNMSCAISTTAVSFIAPVAQNDFNLDTFTKGILNGSPFFGMLLGAYFWGICGDMKGRRFVILASMGLDAIFSVLSCLTHEKEVFFLIRMGNGFAIIGAVCMVYVYLGEFLTPEKRDSYLLLLELFWSLGMIASPGLAMMVIPKNIVLPIEYTHFYFNSWRIFIILSSIPSLLSFIIIYQYPETPRYLMLTGYMHQSRDILERIYNINKRKSSEPYSVESFVQTRSAIGFQTRLSDVSIKTNLKKKLKDLINDHKILFSNYCRNITVTCLLEFCLMASYTAVLVWIPELFSRYENYMKLNPEHTNICKASQWLLKNNNNLRENEISADAYLPSLIVAIFTIPLVIITGIVIKCLNKNLLIFISCGVPIFASLLILLTENDIQAEIMCSIFEGFTTLTEPILFCCMVELFPSNVRGVAFSLTVLIGRFGAVFGILVFGVLMDSNCKMIFYLLLFLLLIAFTTVSFLPKLKIGGGH